MSNRAGLFSFAVAAIATGFISGSAHAESIDGRAWKIGKTSGEVWVTTPGVQPASLGDTAAVKAGDSIRTGRNGRVLLVRGEEKILIAPNSVVAIPEKSDASSTTIVQQAGSILLEVEKRDSRNFEVETPYLVAAVKGTQFRVSVADQTARVDVVKGQVEVAENRSGRFALVLPGQTATTSIRGHSGLSVRGLGVIGPIQQGLPRANVVPRVPVPRGGFTAPSQASGRQVHALGRHGNVSAGGHARAPGTAATHHRGNVAAGGHGRALRIGAPLGEVRLDVQKATRGLARAPSQTPAANRTAWRSGELTPGNGVGKTYNSGNSGSGNALGSSGGNGNASTGGNVAASSQSDGNGNGNGNGNGKAWGLTGGNGYGYAWGRYVRYRGNGNAWGRFWGRFK